MIDDSRGVSMRIAIGHLSPLNIVWVGFLWPVNSMMSTLGNRGGIFTSNLMFRLRLLIKKKMKWISSRKLDSM
jgi:hypothetical protein